MTLAAALLAAAAVGLAAVSTVAGPALWLPWLWGAGLAAGLAAWVGAAALLERRWPRSFTRLATGVALVWEEAPLGDADRARALGAVGAGYAEGLADPDALGPLPRFASELVARAEVAGGDRAELRALDRDEHATTFVEDDRFAPPDAAEETLVRSLLAAWAPIALETLEGLPEALRASIAKNAPSAIAAATAKRSRASRSRPTSSRRKSSRAKPATSRRSMPRSARRSRPTPARSQPPCPSRQRRSNPPLKT